MSAKANYFRLGLFVLVALGLLFGGIVALGAGSWFKHGIVAETYFDESVQGVDKGSPVKYRGVQIGKVRRIGFVGWKYDLQSMKDPIQFGRYVFAEIEITADFIIFKHGAEEAIRERVESGLRLRIASGGLTGPVYLEADYYDPKLYPPLPIEWKPQHLYIPSAPSMRVQLTSAAESLAKQLEQLDLPKVSQDISRLVQNVDKAVTDLQIDRLREEALTLLTSLQQNSRQLNQLFTDPRVENILTNASHAADSGREAVAEINETARTVNAMTEQQRRQVQQVMENLRRFSQDLAEIGREARQNPARLLFGQPPPREQPGEKK